MSPFRSPVLLRPRPDYLVEGMYYDGTPESAANIVDWADGKAFYREGELVLDTADGRHDCGADWWVLKDPLGLPYPVDPRVIEIKYDQVGEGRS